MTGTDGQSQRLTEEGVRADLQRQPHVFMRLAENALTVAESLRDNYFKNTASFITDLRKAAYYAKVGKRDEPIIVAFDADTLTWEDVQDEVVTFIDGGVGQVELSGQVPILLRVGSYAVRTGERNLAEREQFGYYPVILGDLEGGSKERKDFIDIVRITAELLGGLAALKRTPDLRVLMFHGPLVYQVGRYTVGEGGHTPFTEADIDLFLDSYTSDAQTATELKEAFLEEARLDIYPKLVPERADELVHERLFDPLAWMAFLYRQLIREAGKRYPVPIIAGAVERSQIHEFCEEKLLTRVFRGLREKGHANHFNELYGRTDLTSPKNLLNKLNYNDTLLLAMLLEPGQRTESWGINKYGSLRKGYVTLPGETARTEMDWRILSPDQSIGFPHVEACYVCISEITEPVRVEVFSGLSDDQVDAAARRAYLYSRLLPGYGFPVGLDVVDKFAKVPRWLTDAYGKLIRHHLGVSLQRGEISDREMRRLLVQAIYMTHRDWLFRPNP